MFVVAWIGQFIGHKCEGQRPSFFTDLGFLLIGPLWTLRKLYQAGRHCRHASRCPGLAGATSCLVALICLAWAGNFLTSKLALREIPPLLFTALAPVLLVHCCCGAFLKVRHAPPWIAAAWSRCATACCISA